MAISDMVISTLINLFSSYLHERRASICERIKLWKFRKELIKWTRAYINKHDGSVLTTGDFESFLQHHNLIENIFKQVMGTSARLSKDEFIRGQIALFHNIQRHPEKNTYDTDKVLKEFIEYFYDEIKTFFENNLSQNEKYTIARLNEEKNAVIDAVQNVGKANQEEIGAIKKILQRENELHDSNLVWSIYQNLSSLIYAGKISDVLQIYSLLVGKSDDLEISISFLLGLFTDDMSYSKNFDTISEKVKDERIYNDICRTAIYISQWRNNKEFCAKITNRNTDLWNIAQSLKNGKYDQFYSIKIDEKDGLTYYNYHLENNYPNEEWIVKRICLLDISQQNVFNSSVYFKDLIGNSENIIDRIILLKRRITEVCNKFEADKNLVTELNNEVYDLVGFSESFAKDIKVIVFKMLLQTALLLSMEEADKAAAVVPESLYGIRDIDFLLLQVELKKGTVESDRIINTCMKYNEYWLFNNYLVENVNKNPLEMKALIEKYRFVIDEDAYVFLIYAQLVNEFEGQEKASRLLADYEEKYGDILEYWIDRLRIKYSDEELNATLKKYKGDGLKHISIGGIVAFVKILLHHKKFNEAVEIIKKYEAAENVTNELLRLKAYALCNTKHEIEALSVYTKLFEAGDQSEEIIYYIMALSYNNRRLVSDTMLSVAEQSDNPQVLSVVAMIYAMASNMEKASKMVIKAMLRTVDNKSNIYNQYISIETMEEHPQEITVGCIDVDTVVTLCDSELHEKVYAIHSVHHLPQEPFNWENAIHIYKERAITLGLLRKRVGDSVSIDEHSYVVKEILPLSAFLFRLSMQKVVANGEAQMLSIPFTEDGGIDIEGMTKTLKEVIGDDKKQNSWLDLYKDLSQMPVTFYYSKRFVRVTYFEMVSALLLDEKIIFRESIETPVHECNSFILSYAALVVLFKMGWTYSNEKMNCSIPAALRTIIETEADEVIRNNNRDHVSYMGINNEQPYFVETTEIDKSKYMREAVEFKTFSEGFNALGNANDLNVDENHLAVIKDVLGIADYDAIVIAKNSEKTLVSAELMITGICHMPEVDVPSICIADFLAKEVKDINDLLGYIKKMVECKCTVPFTLNTIYRIFACFDEAGIEEKKNIINSFLEILKLPMEDESYRTVMLSLVQDCLSHMKRDEDLISPIGKCLFESWLMYSGQKVEIIIDEDGNIIPRIVKNDDTY